MYIVHFKKLSSNYHPKMDAKIKILYELLIIMIMGISQLQQSCGDFRVWHDGMLNYFLPCSLHFSYTQSLLYYYTWTHIKGIGVKRTHSIGICVIWTYSVGIVIVVKWSLVGKGRAYSDHQDEKYHSKNILYKLLYETVKLKFIFHVK